MFTFMLGLATIGLGLKSRNRIEEAPDPGPGPPQRYLDLSLLIAAVLVAAFTWYQFRDPVGDRKVFGAVLVAPFAIVGLAWLSRFAWPAVMNGLMGVRVFRWLRSVLADPLVVVPIGAFVGLAVLSQVKAILAPYALVVFSPFIAVIAARGIARMRRLRAPVGAAVLAVFGFSVYQYATTPISAREYQGLALQMMPLMEQGETVLIANEWYAVPINYYLRPDQYRVLPPPATDSARAALPDTLWIVGFGQTDEMIDSRLREIEETVPGLVEIARVSTGTSAAGKFVRR